LRKKYFGERGGMTQMKEMKLEEVMRKLGDFREKCWLRDKEDHQMVFSLILENFRRAYRILLAKMSCCSWRVCSV
jgi:hypothetical protein